LEGQIEAVIQNPNEMGSKWENVVRLVSGDPKYSRAFAATYPEGVNKKSIQNALASYERTLITPASRFDKYLRGNSGAITTTEQLGYMMFKRYGCVACHQGKNVGGNMFQKFGVMADYFAQRGKPTDADLGRLVVTGKVEDKHVFKVPSLRNVELTAPYFHDGSAGTLEDAVDVMFRYQLGRIAAPGDKAAIVAFLKTLTAQPGTEP
jgi:cytochrome c peroxidase